MNLGAARGGGGLCALEVPTHSTAVRGGQPSKMKPFNPSPHIAACTILQHLFWDGFSQGHSRIFPAGNQQDARTRMMIAQSCSRDARPGEGQRQAFLLFLLGGEGKGRGRGGEGGAGKLVGGLCFCGVGTDSCWGLVPKGS